MYELKKNGKVFMSKFVGTGPSSYKKRIYRAAVSQRLRNTRPDNYVFPGPSSRVLRTLPALCRPTAFPGAVFLKLGSTKGCQRFREKKIRTGGRVLLAFLNLYVRITVRVATLYTNHLVTDYTQTISSCFSSETS